MRGINIERPMLVIEKQRMYGDVFHTTPANQQAYDCVQPLQGMITFGEPDSGDFYRNNLSNQKHEERPETKRPDCMSWDSVIYVMLVTKGVLGAVMLSNIERQTAFNDIYLTNFDPSPNYETYTIVGAGMTNPLYCLLIALSLVIFSVIIGLTSSKKYISTQFGSFFLVVVLLILQGTAFGLHVTMLVKEQAEFKVGGLTTVSMIFLHVVTLLLSIVGLMLLARQPQSTMKDLTSRISKKQKNIEDEQEVNRILFEDNLVTQTTNKHNILTLEDIYRETIGNFWLCVVEDLNTIVCYAFIVRACDAQSSIHDDSTTFFDVLCIVFLGFLQHVANILMVFHAHIEKQTELNMKGKPDDKKKVTHHQLEELVTFIARTRLLLFFMIGVTVVFFYLRIAPTYVEYPIAIPYEILRVLALITMVSLNTLHSFWYEVQSAHNSKKTWDTSPTWKLGALAFIALVFSFMLYFNTLQDSNVDTRHLLHKLEIRTTPTPGTPAPALIGS